MPKLRFPEFDGEWNLSTMGEIGTFIKGANLSKADISDSGTPFILYGELYTTYNEVTKKIVRKTNRTVATEHLSQVGDVIIPTSGETPEEIATSTCVMLPNVILAGDLNIYRNKIIDGRFLSYVINHIVNGDISRIAQGKSVVHIKADELKKIKISYPSKEEQSKIISIFDLLDTKIEKQQQLIENLKTYKRGVLKSLELKYLTLENYNPIGEYFKVQGGYSFKSDLFSGSGIPIVRISDINNNTVTNFDFVFYPENIDIDKKFIVKKSDLLIAMSGATTGKTGIYPFETKAYLNQRVGKFNAIKEISIDYLSQVVESTSFVKALNNMLVAGAQPNISPNDIENISIPIFPSNIRTKISDILKLLSLHISKEENLLLNLYNQKESLLQQMFI